MNSKNWAVWVWASSLSLQVFSFAERPNPSNLFGVLLSASGLAVVAFLRSRPPDLTRTEDRSKPDGTNP